MRVCPVCGKEFKGENQFHPCYNVPARDHFKSKKDYKDIYDLLVLKINDIGNYTINSTKNAIEFKDKSTFMAFAVKKDHVRIEFYSNSLINSGQIFRTLQVSKHRIVHSVIIIQKEEIDKELLGWIVGPYQLTNNN